ncbi:MAG: hypothetical protein LBH58_13740 [Tannerellaceae bacterium]|nr:hypothetical protein [Tannerellaceae bacterium]
MKRNIIHKNKVTLKARKYSLFLLFFSFSILNGLQAQVTIGSDLPPAEGVLLDLKENEANERGATSDKGILFPRVELTSLTSLELLTNSAGPMDKSTYRGTLVYNIAVSPEKNLREGLYYWNGDMWVSTQDDTDAWKKIGNAGTDSTKNFLGTSDNKSLALKANNQEGLRISPEGELYIANAEELPNSKVLVRNNQGKVGLLSATDIVPMLMFIQSGEEQLYGAGDMASFNQGGAANARVVTWKAADIITNNVVDYTLIQNKSIFEEFTILQNGVYELSGFILYQPNSILTINTVDYKKTIVDIKAAYAGVNVAIQLKKGDGMPWENISVARQIWTLAVSGATNTVIVPPITRHFNAGDKLRMIFYRPTANFGLPHGGGGNDGKFGIFPADGLDIEKGLKIELVN